MKGVTVRRKLHRDQRGITLIEMTVAIALIGLIAAGIAMTISQVMAVNSRTSSKMVALRQVQQAGDRVSKDVLQAQQPLLEGGYLLRLTIPYWEVVDEVPTQFAHSVNYTLEDMPGQPGLKQLVRYSSEPTRIIAQYIDASQTSVSWNATAYQLTFKVTARVGMQVETRVYEIQPRPGS